MKKLTKLSIQWFYNLLERGECDIMDFKEQLEDKVSRLFAELVSEKEILQTGDSVANNVKYRRLRK